MSQANISIHVAQKHTCGRMHETILHVKDANLEGFVNTYYPPFEPVRSGDFTLPPEPETENKLELTGSLGGIELTTCVCHLSRAARVRRWIAAYLRSLFRQTKETQNMSGSQFDQEYLDKFVE